MMTTIIRQYIFQIKWDRDHSKAETYIVNAESKGQAVRKLTQSFWTPQEYTFIGEIAGEIK